MQTSSFEIVVENLPSIEFSYSDGVAARVLNEVWSRFETMLTPERWQVSFMPWGISLQQLDVSCKAWSELEMTVHAVASTPVSVGGIAVVVRLCFGNPPLETGSDAVLPFDKAQYRADMKVIARVYSAINKGKILLAEQPVTDASKASNTLYRECLLRVVDKEGQLLMPAEYIPAMERLGLTRAFDREVVKMLMGNLRRRKGEVLGCNISGLSAVNDLWWNSLLSKLAFDRDLARRLVIEITETAMPPDMDRATAFVDAVRATGARVALDDYGAGFSTTSFTQPAGVDIVKIDRSFLGLSVPADEEILSNLIGKARVLGDVVVVEGVETEEDLELALRVGARWFQGYLFGKPVCSLHNLTEYPIDEELAEVNSVGAQ